MNTVQWLFESQYIKLYLVASRNGLVGAFWKKQNSPIVSDLNRPEPHFKILAKTTKQLNEYLQGDRKSFDIPFDIQGTAFQKKVWNQLSKIPYGETCSYSEIAKRIKNDRAVRAVGTANGKNPLSIIVPCHRVIAANGTLGGYAGGLAIKTKLLELERAITN